MKHRVTVEIPLSGASFGGFVLTDTFTVPPPCFYCGAEVAEDNDYHFTKEGEYQIQYWGRGRKFGSPMLGDVVDGEGNKLKGKYQLKIPYCPDHLKPAKFVRIVDITTFILGIALGLGVAFWAYQTGSREGEFLIFLIGGPFVMVSVLRLIGMGIKALIAKAQPKYKDYALGSGHYGIEDFGVTIHGGASMVGPITYTLSLGFCDPGAARRFIEANPRARVTKGEKLLSEPAAH